MPEYRTNNLRSLEVISFKNSYYNMLNKGVWKVACLQIDEISIYYVRIDSIKFSDFR